MSTIDELRRRDSRQRNVVHASFVGWMLDAFDCLIVMFVISSIAADFHTGIGDAACALT